MKRRTRNYAKRQLTWMRKLAGVRVIDVTGRDPADGRARDPRLRRLMTMRFEKWQALGNDYLIVERDELPFELTPARVRRLCEGHFGVFADGVLLLSPPARPGARGRPAHLQPRRLGGRAVGQRRARGDPVPAPPRLDRPRQFSIHTAAGEIRPTITGPDTCRVDMGRASLRSEDFPGGPADGRGEVARRRARRGASGTSRSATRNARSTSTRVRGARRRSISPRSARRSKRTRTSRTARTCRGTRVSGSRRTADPHPRADLRARRGGDARPRAPARRAPRSRTLLERDARRRARRA